MPAFTLKIWFQLIFGLGLPMEVDVSTIIGYVMKCNYALPSNASYLTNPYTRYARSMKYDGKILENFPSASDEKGMFSNYIMILRNRSARTDENV